MPIKEFAVKLPGERHRAIPEAERQIVKRDGTVVPWDESKITRAIALAFFEVRNKSAPNPLRDDAARSYGLESKDFLKAVAITHRASQMLELHYLRGRNPGIEEIQDVVEKAIASEGEWEVARAYILYREMKAELRLHKYGENGMREYIAVSKYARYRPELKRRETFEEAVERVAEMHRLHFREPRGTVEPATALAELESAGTIAPETAGHLRAWISAKSLEDLISDAFLAVREQRVLPSMRSLQFGGEAILAAHARMFNCAFSPVDRIAFFREYLYLLLAGTGCGFSVQEHHVAHLPALPHRKREMDLPVRHHTVGDTIEGWADALHELFESYLNGYKVEYNFSAIRPRGAPLKTSGGKAPGHLPLKRALERSEEILAHAAGRRLKPIEAYDICMHVSKAVLAGGVRRSATICLFSADDADMMGAKTGNWFEENPQRSASNNSAVIERDHAERDQFMQLFEAQKEFGEPGFYFTADPEYGCNPCCEIGLNPVIRGGLDEEDLARLRALGYSGDVDADTRLSGWQMCNLSTVSAAAATSEEAFLEACFHASVIGTLQAAYTDIPYLGPVSRFINEREALLGVSLCGIMDHPEILLDSATLERGAAVCRSINAVVARTLGTRPAARVTCVKPEGTASLLLGTGSGIHPHHAKRYFRRVQSNRNDPVYRHFHASNPHMTEHSVYNPDTDDVITFPVEAPESAIFRNEIAAVQFLEYVRLVQKYWVQAGCASERYAPGLHHNVSNTCTVKPEEWDDVARFIWDNREYFTGVSLLAHSGDKTYAQAPREEVTTEEDVARWNRLKYQPVDYTKLLEERDETKLKETVACAGGACDL